MLEEGEMFYDNTLEDVKGLSLKYSNKMFINLSAEQWKDLSEQYFLSELIKTITHEACHLEIHKVSEDIYDEEETVCQAFADQLDVSFWNRKV